VDRGAGAIAARYREQLAGLPIALPEERAPARHVYHQFTIRSRRRDALAAALRELGVGTAVHYPSPVPAQPLFAWPDAEEAFPHAARAAREVLSLPCFPELTDEEIRQVAAAMRTALARVAA
jgi:dTDP-4-amino-4,6-dideoxygalactose transaminase